MCIKLLLIPCNPVQLVEELATKLAPVLGEMDNFYPAKIVKFVKGQTNLLIGTMVIQHMMKLEKDMHIWYRILAWVFTINDPVLDSTLPLNLWRVVKGVTLDSYSHTHPHCSCAKGTEVLPNFFYNKKKIFINLLRQENDLT